jgi:hypothetical protein
MGPVPSAMAEGAPEPASLGQGAEGVTCTNTAVRTLLEDGNTPEGSQDTVRLFWNNGHCTRCAVLPGFSRWTLRRVRRNPAGDPAI